MRPILRSLLNRYSVAVLMVAVALATRAALDPFLGDKLPYLLFALAVAAAAWHGGFGPSFLALVLGLVASVYFFTPPRYSLLAALAQHQVHVTGFAFLGLNIGLFSEALQAARRRAEAHASEAIRRRQELEQEVAQRKQLECELQRRADALAEADRRKDEFLAMLGHELRNPLAPIRNAVRILELRGSPDRQLHWACGVIDRQAAQLARLVDDLLDVSRISRGKITLLKEPVELTDVIARAVESCRPQLEERRHELSVALPLEKVWLQADATRLAQVVANLLNNAAKYTAEGGRIGLSAQREGAEIVLRVRDNGVGIEADMLPRVFDLFAQADHTLDRAAGGLGIGLTLVKSLVELHGGRVEAFSAGLGQGSEFVIRLPVLTRDAEPPLTRAAPAPAPPSRRVLAVDDNVDAVESLALLLSAQGHEVRTAYDGPAAVAAAAAFQPEVVFLDIGLPHMDGYEVARRLRGQAGLSITLLVALTGYGQEEDRRRADEAGFDAYLIKPADPTTLQRLLQSATPAVT
jgi:signal transduction histidine kinase/CheY-like chemotaxis protein